MSLMFLHGKNTRVLPEKTLLLKILLGSLQFMKEKKFDHGETPLNNEYTLLKNEGHKCKTGPVRSWGTRGRGEGECG
jgi:hypothetical protein